MLGCVNNPLSALAIQVMQCACIFDRQLTLGLTLALALSNRVPRPFARCVAPSLSFIRGWNSSPAKRISLLGLQRFSSEDINLARTRLESTVM